MIVAAGLDIGTSGGRCSIIREDGTLLAHQRRDWSTHLDADGFLTLDPGVMLEQIRDAFAAATSQAGARPDVIGVTSQRSGVVFCDDEDEVILVSPNADGRALLEGVALERTYGERIHAIAGRLPAMLYLPARLSWLRAHRPKDARRVAHAASLGDWVVAALTGVWATDPTQAAETGVYDVAARRWSADLLAWMDVPEQILPTLNAIPSVAGATRYHIDTGIPVVGAGADTQCALFAVGTTRPGQAGIVAGTTMLVDAVVDASEGNTDPSVWWSPLGDKTCVREAHCGEAGGAVSWFADLLGMDPASMASLAERGAPGAGGVVFCDPIAADVSEFTIVRRGMLSLPVPLFALGRSRADVARAIFEGLAAAACDGLDRVGATGAVTVCGGVAASRVFIDAIAGMSERPVEVCDDPASASARGAAMVAAAGVGVTIDPVRTRRIVADERHGYPAHRAAWRAARDLSMNGSMTIKDVMG